MTDSMPSPDAECQRRRNRAMLIAILVVFFGSFVLAGVLRYSGWRPAGTGNKGEMLQPPGDLRGVAPRLQDGAAYAWQPEARIWRIAVVAPPGCGQRCETSLEQLHLVWQLFGRKADRVHVLWIGDAPARTGMRELRVVPPTPELLAQLPRAGEHGTSLPAFVIDPNGFVVLRYAAGADPGDLRADLARLLRLK